MYVTVGLNGGSEWQGATFATALGIACVTSDETTAPCIVELLFV